MNLPIEYPKYEKRQPVGKNTNEFDACWLQTHRCELDAIGAVPGSFSFVDCLEGKLDAGRDAEWEHGRSFSRKVVPPAAVASRRFEDSQEADVRQHETARIPRENGLGGLVRRKVAEKNEEAVAEAAGLHERLREPLERRREHPAGSWSMPLYVASMAMRTVGPMRTTSRAMSVGSSHRPQSARRTPATVTCRTGRRAASATAGPRPAQGITSLKKGTPHNRWQTESLAASLPEGVESPDTGLWVPTADKKTVPPVERVAQAV